MANLSYMRNFCFSNSSKDELSYCLSTFEAAVEYINLGKLQNTCSVRHTLKLHVGSQQMWDGSERVAVIFFVSCSQVTGELRDKALFKERMSLLTQNVAAPVLRLFEVSRNSQAAASLNPPVLSVGPQKPVSVLSGCIWTKSLEKTSVFFLETYWTWAKLKVSSATGSSNAAFVQSTD